MSADRIRPIGGARPADMLARMLETPDLVRTVQGLHPRMLARVIDTIGLEDAGEIAALVTTRQLEAVFDHDLWRAERPGEDERLDADRFVLWLTVLSEAGETFAARKLLELDEDLVTLALSELLIVLDADRLTLETSERTPSDDALVEKALESNQYFELDRYVVVARCAEGFDTIIALLTTLDRDHHDFVERLLDRCCELARTQIEDEGGLYEALTGQASLEADVAGARADRREARGFVTVADARGFLALAGAGSLEEVLADTAVDAITAAYFRHLTEEPVVASTPETRAEDESIAKLSAWIEQADDVPIGNAAALLGSPPDAPRTSAERRSPLALAIERISVQEPALHATRVEELAYLANVLLAGCAHRGRGLRSVEAAQLAMAVCELGVERIAETLDEGRTPSARAEHTWSTHGAVKAFRIGWKALHDDLSRTPTRSWDDVLDGLLDGHATAFVQS
ncbi:MAG: DUF6178 family protein [Polyangiales bacterium]